MGSKKIDFLQNNLFFIFQFKCKLFVDHLDVVIAFRIGGVKKRIRLFKTLNKTDYDRKKAVGSSVILKGEIWQRNCIIGQHLFIKFEKFSETRLFGMQKLREKMKKIFFVVGKNFLIIFALFLLHFNAVGTMDEHKNVLKPIFELWDILFKVCKAHIGRVCEWRKLLVKIGKVFVVCRHRLCYKI